MINVLGDFGHAQLFAKLARLLSNAVFTGKSKFPVEMKLRFISTKIRSER